VHAQELAVMDFAEAPLHVPQGVWQALVEGAARPDIHLKLREPSAWVRGAMGLLGERVCCLEYTVIAFMGTCARVCMCICAYA